ncbi:hypothetical protein [Exiguobacterium sp. R-17]|uniref:hypothetical protein n=1 Tax=Exiguobacterium sp. R-17 TaxID=3404054 RepID=UPI003CEA63D7
MTKETRLWIEQLTGDIEHVEKLGEQGGTSIVYRVEAKKGSYLLKTATKARYQEWLDEDLMEWREGITLTRALKQATNTQQIRLWKDFGEYLFQFHQQTTVGTSSDWLIEWLMTAERYVASDWTSGTMDLLDRLKETRPQPIDVC